MDDSKIVVVINMFTITQNIYLPTGQIVNASLNELAEIVPDLCYENEVYAVEIRGAATYIPKVIHDMELTEMTKYNANKIVYTRNKEFK